MVVCLTIMEKNKNASLGGEGRLGRSDFEMTSTESQTPLLCDLHASPLRTVGGSILTVEREGKCYREKNNTTSSGLRSQR